MSSCGTEAAHKRLGKGWPGQKQTSNYYVTKTPFVSQQISSIVTAQKEKDEEPREGRGRVDEEGGGVDLRGTGMGSQRDHTGGVVGLSVQASVMYGLAK